MLIVDIIWTTSENILSGHKILVLMLLGVKLILRTEIEKYDFDQDTKKKLSYPS